MKKYQSFLLFIPIVIFLFLRPIDGDGDFYQHVNIGRYVIENHRLPYFDDLTFSAAGRPYIGYSWGSGLIFYFVLTKFGATGINILVLATAIFSFFLMHEFLRSYKTRGISIFISLLCAAPIVSSRFPSRPEIFVFPILAAVVLIDRFKEKRQNAVYLIPFLSFLLSILYGSSFPMLAVILILMTVKSLYTDGFRIRRKKIKFYSLIILSFLIVLFNGYGTKSLFFVSLVSGMTDLWSDWIGIIGLLSGPDFHGFSKTVILAYILYFLFYSVSVFLGFGQARKFPFLTFLSLGLIVPFIAVRQRALVAFLSIPLFCLIIDHSLKYSRIQAYIAGFTGIILILIISVESRPGWGANEFSYPPSVIKFIRQHDIGRRVFNTPRLGSYLSYSLYPQVLTFSDTRDDLFVGTGILEEMNKFLVRGSSIKYLLNKYRADFVVVSLTDGSSFRDLFYDNEFAPVYFDGNYLIFVKREAAIMKKIPIIEGVDPYKI